MATIHLAGSIAPFFLINLIDSKKNMQKPCQAVFRMNDKEKVEAIRKTLSLKIQGLMTYLRYVGLIHDIMDSKMTMTEVDEYVKDNFELDSSKSDS